MRRFLGLHLFDRGCLPVRRILVLLCMCAKLLMAAITVSLHYTVAVASGQASWVLAGPLFCKLANMHVCTLKMNLFPRPHPVFHHLANVVRVTESWARAWEQDYSFSTQCESESCLPMITAKKRSPSNFFAMETCLPIVAAMSTSYLTEST